VNKRLEEIAAEKRLENKAKGKDTNVSIEQKIILPSTHAGKKFFIYKTNTFLKDLQDISEKCLKMPWQLSIDLEIPHYL